MTKCHNFVLFDVRMYHRHKISIHLIIILNTVKMLSLEVIFTHNHFITHINVYFITQIFFKFSLLDT